MSTDKKQLDRIAKELETISIALTILTMSQTGAEDADERKRHESAIQQGLNILLGRLERF